MLGSLRVVCSPQDHRARSTPPAAVLRSHWQLLRPRPAQAVEHTVELESYARKDVVLTQGMVDGGRQQNMHMQKTGAAVVDSPQGGRCIRPGWHHGRAQAPKLGRAVRT